MQASNNFDFVPVVTLEITYMIFRYFNVRDLGRITCVSKVWKQMATDYHLWKKIFMNRYPIKITQNKKVKYDWKKYLKRETLNTAASNLKNHIFQSHSFIAHERPITCLKMNKEIMAGTKYHLASASWDNTIRLWDIGNPDANTLCLRGHRGGIMYIEWKNEIIASASDDTTIKIWNKNPEYQLAATLCGHKGTVWNLDFNDNVLTSCSVDGTIRFWDMKEYNQLSVIENIIGIKKVKLFGDNLLYGYLNGVSSMNLERQIVIPFKTKESAKLIETTNDFVIVGHPGSYKISLYDYRTLEPTIHFPQRELISIDYYPANPNFVYSSNRFQTVNVWDIRMRKLYSGQDMNCEGISKKPTNFLFRPSFHKEFYLESIQITATKILSTNGNKIIWNDYNL